MMRRARAHPFPPKLGYADAERIRERYAAGESARALAREYSISVSCLYDVVNRRSHAGRVVVVLMSSEMAKLDGIAEKTGATREQVASAILRSRLAQIPSAPVSSDLRRSGT